MTDPLPPVSLFSSEEEVTFDPLDPTLLKILQDVMGDTGVLEESLREHDLGSIQDVLSLTLEQIDELTMPASRMKTRSGSKDPDLPREPLSLGKRGILKAFKGYVWWYHINHGYPPAFGFIQKTDFDDFRISSHWNPEALFDTSLPGLSSSSYKRDPAEDFKRGIKRDPNHYSVFKEDKQWDSWRRSTISTARSHGCEQVFQPKYRPSSKDDKALFDEKQKFVYSVFETTLKTDMGKYFVRQHEHDYDAQAVFAKLEKHAISSTQATLDSSGLLAYLTSAKFDSGWKGTATSFILHWCDKLRIYEDLIPIKDHFGNSVKLTLLQNTVATVDTLNQVKLQSAHDVTHGGVELTFSQYKNLLLSATAAYDAKLGLSQPRSLRRTQEHSWTDSSGPDDASFDIDTDVTELSAFAARRSFPGTPRHRLSREQWRALSASDRSIWDQLPNASKAIILGTSLATSASAQTPVPAPADPPHRRLNLHDISAADYLDILSIHKLACNPGCYPCSSHRCCSFCSLVYPCHGHQAHFLWVLFPDTSSFNHGHELLSLVYCFSWQHPPCPRQCTSDHVRDLCPSSPYFWFLSRPWRQWWLGW